MNYIISLWI